MNVIYYFLVADAVVALGRVFSYGHRGVHVVSKVRLNQCYCFYHLPAFSPLL